MPSLEALFERYRSAGDLAAMAEVFDRTARELLGLAAHLVRDPVEAEDLVQTTFLVALENARRFDPSRRLAPWLAGILVRQAMRVRRERARKADPARLERPPVAEPSLVLEQRELAAALAGALDGLEEPYRGVLARHLRGERALDIAHASGRAPGTVRMQILRGLERLRRGLPAGLYGTALAPRGLEAVRAEVLARVGGLALGSGSALASSLAGGVLVSTKLVACAAVALVLVLVLLSRSRREPEAEHAPSVAAASDVAGAALRALDEPQPASSAVRVPASVGEPQAVPVEAAARQAATAAPSAGVFLTGALFGLDPLDPELVDLAVTTQRGDGKGGKGSREGRYAIEITELLDSPKGAPPALYVTAVHPGGRKDSREFPLPDAARSAARDQRTELELDLDLSPRTTVVGRVKGCEGQWPAEIHVGLIAGAEVVCAAECDEQGAFILHPPSGGAYALVARAGQVPQIGRAHV